MGNNTNPRIPFICEYCEKQSSDKPSQYTRKKRHFCSRDCYSLFRKERLPKEEQNSFGTGYTPEERNLRRKARSITNHAIRDHIITRDVCEVCGSIAEAHHDNYDEPLQIRWLCFKHHRMYHENPELLSIPTPREQIPDGGMEE